MTLTFDNLGAIKHIDIDLSKQLILFCGPNSTGKTYASYVLFAFLTNGSMLHTEALDKMADEVRANGEFAIQRCHIEEWLERTCREVESQIGNVFGIAEETRLKLFSKFILSCSYDDADFQRTLDYEINASASDGSVIFNIRKEAGSPIVKIESSTEDAFSTQALRTNFLLNALLANLAFANRGTAQMLTVERNSIYTFKTELSLSRNELIDRIQQNNTKSDYSLFDMVNMSSRRYPLAVKSSLRIANDLENVQKQQSRYAGVAAEIEQNLLRGEVSVTKNGDVEFHASTMPKTRRLPFHLSSSIVKTMASLVVFLRHLASPGDTLIVDEPEMNFHPDVQIVLAGIFAKLSNMGLRVVISTHSDYIIREFNNMIMAKVLIDSGDAEKAHKVGYSDDLSIDKKRVGVLFFHQKANAKAVTVKSLPIEDNGFEISTIDETVLNQNQRAEWLYDCLSDRMRIHPLPFRHLRRQ